MPMKLFVGEVNRMKAGSWHHILNHPQNHVFELLLTFYQNLMNPYLIVDNYTLFSWLFPLQNKTDVNTMFQYLQSHYVKAIWAFYLSLLQELCLITFTTCEVCEGSRWIQKMSNGCSHVVQMPSSHEESHIIVLLQLVYSYEDYG